MLGRARTGACVGPYTYRREESDVESWECLYGSCEGCVAMDCDCEHHFLDEEWGIDEEGEEYA